MSKKKHIVRKFNKSIIAIMAIPFISIIMYKQVVDYAAYFLEFNVAQGTGYIDIFSFWKMVAICIVGIVMIVSIGLNYENYTLLKEKKLKPYVIALAGYALLIILSIIFSDFTHFSLVGMYERYEGGLVLIAYLVFVYYIINNMKEEIDFKYVFYSILIASSFIIVIAVLQGLKVDLLTTSFFSSLMGFDKNASITANFASGWAYSTLYNPNNLAMYTAMVLPVITGLFFYFKNKKARVYIGALIICDLLALWFSHTTTGLLAIFMSIFFFIILNLKFIWSHKKIRVVFISLVSVGLILVVALFTGLLGEDTLRTLDEKAGINSFQDGDIYIKDIILYPRVAELVTNEYKLYFSVENGEIDGTYVVNFINEDGTYIKTRFNEENKTIYIDEEFYKTVIKVRFYDTGLIDLSFGSTSSGLENTIRFAYSPDKGFFGIVGPNGLVLEEVKSSNMPEWLQGNEKMMSRRMYIWAVAITDLNDNILIGDGPDTFRVTFDQFDIIGKMNMMHQSYTVIDKPHNLYIQIAQGTGIISLVTYLFLMISYLIWSIKIYIHTDYKDGLRIMGMGLSTAVVSYLASGFFIDSTVSVTPLFYMIFGLGISINLMISKNRR